MQRKSLSVTAAAVAMMILILDSKSAILSAAEGIQLCIQTVIPSLFPFFILSAYLTGSHSNGKISSILTRLFHAPKESGSILVSTLLGGYPVGAQAAAQAMGRGTLNRNQACRLLSFCSQAGPSFLFGIAASGFPSMKYPWLLWSVQILSAISVAWILPDAEASSEIRQHPVPITLSGAMNQAIRAMASVCGWVVSFRVLIRFLQRWILWMLPAFAQVLICGMLEITNGILLLNQIESISLRFLLAALFLNLGGLCVYMQTVSVCEGMDIGCYLRGKLLQTLFAIGYACLFLGYLPGALLILSVFLCRIAWTARKNSSIPIRIGV